MPTCCNPKPCASNFTPFGDFRLTLIKYGTAHEHKGPADFNGRGNDEDDDDDGTPPLEDQPEHPLPPQLQNQASYMHMRHAPSTSPPIGNGYLPQRSSTPHMGSRPGSRNTIRRPSSNLGHMQMSQAGPNANGYAYMPNPPTYNVQGAHHALPARHSMPNQQHQGQGMPNQQSGYYAQQQHPQHSQVQQAYSQDNRRQSMPPTFPQHERHQQQSMQSPPQPQNVEPAHAEEDENQLRAPKPMSKSRSIFTPIDEGRSLLAQHWGDVKVEKKTESDIRSQSVDLSKAPQHMTRNTIDRTTPRNADFGPQATQQKAAPAARAHQPPEFPPPSRTNSAPMGAKRPQLKVQIPSEKSDDDGSASAASSPHQSNVGDTPAKASTEASHSSSGVVLPPPSPSASAILSAGAQGPPNPFARPHPPSHPSQNSHTNASNNNNNNIETPISALPSRFVADGLLPSPSSFYPEWGFGRAGGESNMLPSPLNFQTPVAGSGPSFRDDDNGDKKRKSPEGEQEASNLKRLKT